MCLKNKNNHADRRLHHLITRPLGDSNFLKKTKQKNTHFAAVSQILAGIAGNEPHFVSSSCCNSPGQTDLWLQWAMMSSSFIGICSLRWWVSLLDTPPPIWSRTLAVNVVHGQRCTEFEGFVKFCTEALIRCQRSSECYRSNSRLLKDTHTIPGDICCGQSAGFSHFTLITDTIKIGVQIESNHLWLSQTSFRKKPFMIYWR